MKIGLFFGSFNPIHIGHLIIARYILNITDINKIWFIVSPQNPLKSSRSLLNEYHRLHLVRLAVEDESAFAASDIEFKLPKPSFTIDTLTYLKEKHPNTKFSVILGSDSYRNIYKWKNHLQLISNYEFIIYNRPGFEVHNSLSNIYLLENVPLLQISSTEIRKLLEQGKSIRYLVPEKVYEEIMIANYYKN